MPRISRRGFLQGMAAAVALAAQPVRAIAAQPATSGLLAIKTAATDYLLATGFDRLPQLSRVDLAARSGDYALIHVYPPPGTGEIARVVLGKQSGQWTGLIYGGIFPDAESRMGAPEALFMSTPFFAQNAAPQSDPRDPARQVFQSPWFSFEYPADARISLSCDLPGPNAVAVVGESYQLDLQPLDATVDQLLDNWAFDWYPANGNRFGGPAVDPSLVGYSTQLAVNNAYQVDRPSPQGVASDFLVAPKLGGGVVLVRTIGPERPAGIDPDAPPGPRIAAVRLLLDSLRIGAAPSTEQGAFVDTVAGFSVAFPPEWWSTGHSTGSGCTLYTPNQQTEVWISALAATSLDEAVRLLPIAQSPQPGALPLAGQATVGDWEVQIYDFERRTGETSYAPARGYYLQVQPDVVLLVRVSGDLDVGDGVVAGIAPVERQRA